MVINKVQKGFTLIELLVVIAILGVLAAAVLVAINPLEQLARGRDAGRKSTVAQLGHAVEAYFTAQNSQYPIEGVDWVDTLVTAGEVKLAPDNPTATGYTTGCNTANVAENGICYQTNGIDAIVYVRAESASNETTAGCTTGQQTWIVWSSADGKTGLTCTAETSDPDVGITGLN